MSNPVVLNIPDDISAQAQQIAEITSQSVEQVLLDHLKTLAAPFSELPADEQAELEALRYLSDDALWTIAGSQMPAEAQTRAQVLMEKNSRDQISDQEHLELESLAARADQLMVRKAEAAAILTERGHKFSQKDFAPDHG